MASQTPDPLYSGEKIRVTSTGICQAAGDSEITPVTVERVSIIRTEEINAVNAKIAAATGKIIEAELNLTDHAKLKREAELGVKKRTSDLSEQQRLTKIYQEKKDIAMAEEMELERQRAAKHEEAVVHENSRVQAIAQAVLAQKDIEHFHHLIKHHDAGERQAQALRAAHVLELKEAEALKRKLEETVSEVQVIGDTVPLALETSSTSVQVEAKFVPEARIVSLVQPVPAATASAIVEEVPERPVIAVAAEIENKTAAKLEKLVIDARSSSALKPLDPNLAREVD